MGYVWQLFVSFYVNPSGWGISIALVLGAIWFAAFAPPIHKRPWLWAVLAAGAVLFGPTIAFIQVPLQLAANQAMLHFWEQATLQEHLLLAGIPAVLFTGLVQEGLKLVPPLVYMKYGQPISDRNALILGAVAGVGFGVFEAVWIFNTVFASGFSWATVQLYGWQAVIPFWERLSAIGFHAGATALAVYGWNRGIGWRFYLLVALLHVVLNYSAVLFAAHVLTMVQVEVYASVLAAAVVAPALCLRWQSPNQESDAENISSRSLKM